MLRFCCCPLLRHVLLVDPANNAVLAWTKVSLVEAEAVGFSRPELVEEWERHGDNAASVDKKVRVGCVHVRSVHLCIGSCDQMICA